MTKKYEISIGDTLEIGQKSEKEGKVKRQKFVGVLIGKKSTCDQQTIITVRRSAQGFNVEKVFLQEAPQIEYASKIVLRCSASHGSSEKVRRQEK